jgi:heme ABC exporter ATP-binding subunit CcmA
MSEPVVETSGLTKRFGPVVALRGIDLQVRRGSLLAVLGPNGAGKSTLLRLLAGLARPSAGTVRVGDAAGDRRAARREIGFIGHQTFLYPALTARENLRFSARLYGIDGPEERIARLLAEQDLEPLADRAAGTLSRGQAQRLAIARGLVHDPAVVLLDEPMSGLDRAAAGRLAARLGRLRDDGRTLVLVTHDLARASELADAALVLVGGRVAQRAEGAGLAPEDLERAYLAALESGGGPA